MGGLLLHHLCGTIETDQPSGISETHDHDETSELVMPMTMMKIHINKEVSGVDSLAQQLLALADRP